jgi:catechol 2,3-dioxygenase
VRLDLNLAFKHYTEVLGLNETGRDAQGRVYLPAWDETDHHKAVLRRSDSVAMEYMDWKVDSEATLERLSKELEASPLITETILIATGVSASRFPSGLRWSCTQRVTLSAVPLAIRTLSLGRTAMRGMAPWRFDHCELYGDDLDGTVKLFIEVL